MKLRHLLRTIHHFFLIKRIEKTEWVTRYIFSKKHFSKKNYTVKYGAFFPPPKHDKNRISVFRILYLSESEIWTLGQKEVAKKRKKTLLARADMLVNNIIIIGLNIKPENKGMHYRHANIIFPDNEIESKEMATELALKSKLSEPKSPLNPYT